MKNLLPLFVLSVALVGCNFGDPVVGANNDNNENNETNNLSNNSNNVSNNATNNATNNVSNNPTNNDTTGNNQTNNDTNNGSEFTVEETVPAGGATDVDVFPPIRLTFSAPVDVATLTADDVTVSDADGMEIPVQVGVDGMTAILSHQGLTPSSQHRVIVEATAADEEGVTLGEQYAWTFTTRDALEFLSIEPMNGATNVGVFDQIIVTMAADVDAGTIADSNVEVRATQPIEGVANTIEQVILSVDGPRIIIDPPARGWQEYGTDYTVRFVEPFRGIDGAPSGEVGEATFKTVFWSQDHIYRVFNESTDLSEAMAPVSGDTLVTMADPQNARDATIWFFNGVPGQPQRYAAQNREQPGLFLEGSDGNNPALLTLPAGPDLYFEGQKLRPVFFMSRQAGETQQAGESPGSYYIETAFQGMGRGLTTYIDVDGALRLRMDAKAGAPRQVWWFRRVGDR